LVDSTNSSDEEPVTGVQEIWKLVAGAFGATDVGKPVILNHVELESVELSHTLNCLPPPEALIEIASEPAGSLDTVTEPGTGELWNDGGLVQTREYDGEGKLLSLVDSTSVAP
jgi:hypothetical protein